MAVPVWLLLCGCSSVAVPLRLLLCGCSCVAAPVWLLLCGCSFLLTSLNLTLFILRSIKYVCIVKNQFYDNNFLFSGSSLPQEVLLSAVKSVQSNLTAEMSDCCNATLDSVSPAVVVVVVAKQPDDATGGFPKWAISVMIVAGVAAVIIFAAVALAVAFR